jgi:hypothetical protein
MRMGQGLRHRAPDTAPASHVQVISRAEGFSVGRIRRFLVIAANGRNRRNLAVALRSGEGPLTVRFADFRHCAVQASGLLS